MDVVAGRLNPRQSVATDILLGKAVSAVATDHGLRQVDIFDHRLQFPLVCSGPFANRRGRTGERQSLSRLPSVPLETPDKGLARSWSVSNKPQMAPFLSGNPFGMVLRQDGDSKAIAAWIFQALLTRSQSSLRHLFVGWTTGGDTFRSASSTKRALWADALLN